MTYKTPQQPENSFRVTLELQERQPRLDGPLMDALTGQTENVTFQHITKTHLKRLFTKKKVLIKGQNAKATSTVNSGTTYIDILL
ncbi:MAG: hypothetical protein HN509_02015 [Halobacteriovoraceae bacterium]|jgi:hypothetical protein|nr:hypothetical protein [Halobacteriovoraceae bacterium]